MEWIYDQPLDKLYHNHKKEFYDMLESRYQNHLKSENKFDLPKENLAKEFFSILSTEKNNLPGIPVNSHPSIDNFINSFKTAAYRKNKVTAVIEDVFKPEGDYQYYLNTKDPDGKKAVKFYDHGQEWLVKFLAEYTAYEEIINNYHKQNETASTPSTIDIDQDKRDYSFILRLCYYLFSTNNVDIFSKSEELEEGEILLRPSFGDIAELLSELTGFSLKGKEPRYSYIARKLSTYKNWKDNKKALNELNNIKKLLLPFKDFGNYKKVIEDIDMEINYYNNPEKK